MMPASRTIEDGSKQEVFLSVRGGEESEQRPPMWLGLNVYHV